MLACTLGLAHAADKRPLSLDSAMKASGTAAPLHATDIVALCRDFPSVNFSGVPWAALPTEQAARLHIAVRFLDAVVADLQEAAINEDIAMAYIRWERARAARPNDPETFALDAAYRDVLLQRGRARVVQREARSLLAAALGRAANVPSDLEEVDDPRDLMTLLPPSPAALASNTTAHLVAKRSAEALAEQSEGHELTAAKARLAAAEARQDAQRDTFSKGRSAGLELGDAMAAVAHAQTGVRTAQYRAAVYRYAASALGVESPRTPQ
jgi:hypothetical protein